MLPQWIFNLAFAAIFFALLAYFWFVARFVKKTFQEIEDLIDRIEERKR